MIETMSQMFDVERQANICMEAHDYAQALQLLKRITLYAETQANMELLRRMIPSVIECHLQMQNYAMALKYMHNYDYLYQQSETDVHQRRFTLCKGTFYMRTDEFERAEIYLQQLFQIALDEEHDRNLIIYGTYYLGVLQRSEQVDKGLSVASLVEMYVSQQPDTPVETLRLFYIYYVALIQQTRFALHCEKYLQKLAQLYEEQSLGESVAIYYYYDAKLLFLKGHYEQAFARFEQAFSHMNEAISYAEYVFFLQTSIRLFEEQSLFFYVAQLQKRYILMLENTTHHKKQRNVKQTVHRMNLQQAEHIAHHDSLTNIYNRYYLEKEAQNIVLISRVAEENCSCAVFDLDHFKTINDMYGHVVGDEALQQLTKRIQRVLNEQSCLFARYGGDEFVILLRMPVAQAEQTMIGVVEAIRTQPFQLANTEVDVTISIGLVHNEQARLKTFKELFKAADEGLYIAKKNGRDQLYICS